MTEQIQPGSERRDALQVTRRTVLGAVGASVAGGLMAGRVSAQQHAPFVAVQGDTCIPLVPFTGTETVEQLYDYRIPSTFGGDNGATSNEGPYYGSQGTASLQQPETTVTFLYAGPNGLNLVTVHGDVESGTGGSVSWTVEGVPTAAEWRVRDDYYTDPETGEQDDSNFDNWTIAGTTHTVDWTFGDGNTDGGALGPLGEGVDLTITPAYNEDAALWGVAYDGRITDWQFLSGDPTNPTRTSVALDQPVTIGPGPCRTQAAVELQRDTQSNPITPRERGLVSVVMRSNGRIDPGSVVVDSLRFGPPRVVGNGGGARAVRASSGFGRFAGSMSFLFPLSEAGFEMGDTQCRIVGRTEDGTDFAGTDAVRVVRSAGGRDGRRDDGTSGGTIRRGRDGRGSRGGRRGR